MILALSLGAFTISTATSTSSENYIVVDKDGKKSCCKEKKSCDKKRSCCKDKKTKECTKSCEKDEA